MEKRTRIERFNAFRTEASKERLAFLEAAVPRDRPRFLLSMSEGSFCTPSCPMAIEALLEFALERRPSDWQELPFQLVALAADRAPLEQRAGTVHWTSNFHGDGVTLSDWLEWRGCVDIVTKLRRIRVRDMLKDKIREDMLDKLVEQYEQYRSRQRAPEPPGLRGRHHRSELAPAIDMSILRKLQAGPRAS